LIPETTRVALEVVALLEELGISYHVGGSFASSIHGVPRQTRDLDLVVDLNVGHVRHLVSRLEGDFYIDAEMIRSAIGRRGSFNVVHLASGFKIDVFCQQNGFFDRSEVKRRLRRSLLTDLPREVTVATAEDTVLRKLQWYRIGGQVSEQQWTDVLGVLRIQGERIDRDYLEYWAEELEIADLLERALTEA
jgi:hypothetical protein